MLTRIIDLWVRTVAKKVIDLVVECTPAGPTAVETHVWRSGKPASASRRSVST